MEMKAISIQQPWAHYIVTGHKPVENRSWHCDYRGPLLIHASKTFDHDGYEWIAENFSFDMPRKHEFLKGGIIGKADLILIRKQWDSPWAFGPWCFVFENPEELKFMPVKGQLSIFTVNYEVED